MELCDWSVSQCLQTSNEALTMFISDVKVLTFEKNFKFFSSKENFDINF